MKAGYTLPHQRSEDGHNGQHQRRSSVSAESIAFTLLAGVILGLLAGYGIDRLVGTVPIFTLGGVFVGFGLGLYVVFLETK
jgi:F0F1-type ATP synthase assembly protein I